VRTTDEPSVDLAAWLSDAGTPKLVTTSADVKGVSPPVQTQTLVRVPVKINPTPVGAKVTLDGAFNRLVVPEPAGLPYQFGDDTWIESTQYNQWVVGFAAPSQVGQLKTNRATVRIDMTTPQQKVTLRRGQASGGVVRQNPSGDVIGEWTNTQGAQTITIDCGPDDVDANGWLWLLVSVEASPIAGTGGPLLPRWKFEDFSVTYESEVIGPPRAPVLPSKQPAENAGNE
jgi:hypothetical protein